MRFDEIWDSLFKESAVGFIRVSGKLCPIRLADRLVASYFFELGKAEGQKAFEGAIAKPPTS